MRFTYEGARQGKSIRYTQGCQAGAWRQEHGAGPTTLPAPVLLPRLHSHTCSRSFFPSHWIYVWVQAYDFGLQRWSGMQRFPGDFFQSVNHTAWQKRYLNNDCISVKRHCSWAIAKTEMRCRQSLNLVTTLRPVNNLTWRVWDSENYTDSHLKVIVITGKNGSKMFILASSHFCDLLSKLTYGKQQKWQ